MNAKIDEVKARVSTEMSENISELLGRLIVLHTGAPLDLKHVQSNGFLIVEPGGSELYTYDGVPLLRLFPIELSHNHERDGVTITVERKYEILKGRKNV